MVTQYTEWEKEYLVWLATVTVTDQRGEDMAPDKNGNHWSDHWWESCLDDDGGNMTTVCVNMSIISAGGHQHHHQHHLISFNMGRRTLHSRWGSLLALLHSVLLADLIKYFPLNYSLLVLNLIKKFCLFYSFPFFKVASVVCIFSTQLKGRNKKATFDRYLK